MALIVTIHDSAGSGKSTVERALPARLEIAYLDTVAMYRAIAHAVLTRNLDSSDERAVFELSRSIHLDLDCGPTHTRVRVDGHDVSEALRTMEVSKLTSRVAGNQAVRDLLVEQQRAIGEKLGSFVTEGRDQGSVVFPQADAKFVLDASPEKRAQRRLHDMLADGEDVSLQEVLANIVARDVVDRVQWSALLEPDQATVVDTTDLTLQEVVELLVDYIKPGRSSEQVFG